jgi:hypothetical protein
MRAVGKAALQGLKLYISFLNNNRATRVALLLFKNYFPLTLRFQGPAPWTGRPL